MAYYVMDYNDNIIGKVIRCNNDRVTFKLPCSTDTTIELNREGLYRYQYYIGLLPEVSDRITV